MKTMTQTVQYGGITTNRCFFISCNSLCSSVLPPPIYYCPVLARILLYLDIQAESEKE